MVLSLHLDFTFVPFPILPYLLEVLQELKNYNTANHSTLQHIQQARGYVHSLYPCSHNVIFLFQLDFKSWTIVLPFTFSLHQQNGTTWYFQNILYDFMLFLMTFSALKVFFLNFPCQISANYLHPTFIVEHLEFKFKNLNWVREDLLGFGWGNGLYVSSGHRHKQAA